MGQGDGLPYIATTLSSGLDQNIEQKSARPFFDTSNPTPLASVYHQLIRDKAAFFNLSTFYKYAALLDLKRQKPKHRRKNHHTGIRSSAPLTLIHADCTIFRTADQQKHYIYLVQDNFSQAILSYRIAATCEAKFTFENIKGVQQRYLLSADIPECVLLTDDGCENAGAVKQLIDQPDLPILRHWIAQKEISFSNSMIEAVNKQLKYRFLYHQHIPDTTALEKLVPLAIEDYNNRPNNVLNGLTPLEALNGTLVDINQLHHQIQQATKARIQQNKINRCCYYTF